MVQFRSMKAFWHCTIGCIYHLEAVQTRMVQIGHITYKDMWPDSLLKTHFPSKERAGFILLFLAKPSIDLLLSCEEGKEKEEMFKDNNVWVWMCAGRKLIGSHLIEKTESAYIFHTFHCLLLWMKMVCECVSLNQRHQVISLFFFSNLRSNSFIL